MRLFWMFVFIFFSFKEVQGQLDPCMTYRRLSDPTMKSDFILHFGDVLQNISQPTGWVRYMDTDNGSLLTDCPGSTECGVNFQYWMNDSLPSEDEGVTQVLICGRAGSLCCDVNITIKAKNCSSFVVYELVPVRPKVRYCFAADPTTTTTRTTTLSLPTNATTLLVNTTMSSDNTSGLNITMIAAAVGGSLVLILVIVTIFCIRNKIQRSVCNSKDNREWQELNIAAIYRTKRKDLLIPRLMYLSGKPKNNSSMVYLNPRDDDWIDMKELEEIPRTRSELEIFSPPEIDRLGIDISAIYQTKVQDKFIANTKFSSKRMFESGKFSLCSFEDYLPYYDFDKIKFH